MQIPKFLKRKRNIWIIIILVVVILLGWLIFGRGKTNTSIQTGLVSKQDLTETVLATGQVVSKTDLTLSFQSSGVVRSVNVKEGDLAYKGQVLASLSQSSALASLTTAKGALAQAQANYDKLMTGATVQSRKIAEDTVNSAEQDLTNIYNSATNKLNNAYTAIFNAFSVVVAINNDNFGAADQEGIKVSNARNDIETNMQNVEIYIDTDTDVSRMIAALNNVFNDLGIVRTQSDQGIYYSKVSSTDRTSLDTQKANINTAAADITALQHSIASYKLALQKAKDQLDATIAPPTQAEVDLAKAQILSAQGQVESAEATVNNSIIFAPAGGTITHVNIMPGEQASATQGVITLQDIGNMYSEANVSEANVASLKVDQEIDYTFDALGPDEHFAGKILTVNPASTVVSGVVNYKVTGSLENIPGIKPGMTANMTILVAKKPGVLAVPSTALINKNSKQYVRVIDNIKDKTFHEVEVKTGMNADGGLVEIVSGITEGQTVVIYMK